MRRKPSRRRHHKRNLSRRLGVEQLESREVLSTSTISGVVFIDHDNDGQFSDSEIGIADVAIALEGTTKGGDSVSASTTTGAFGAYSFDNLEAGDYVVSSAQASGFLDGLEQVGSVGGTVSDDSIADIIVDADTDASGYNFGELAPAILKGSVYADYDRDNNLDFGDKGLAGVDVQLRGKNDQGDRINVTIQTDVDGSYEFSDLRPGRYDIRSSTPVGYDDGRETMGTFDGNAHPVSENGQLRNDRFRNIDVGSGQVGRNYDFGEFDPTQTSGVLADSFAATFVVEGTSGDDTFEFYAGESTHTVILNGVEQTIDATTNTQIVFYGRGGKDAVQLTGGAGIDKADLRETSAKLTGTSYQILVYSVHFTTVHSGGGQDRAYLYDTLGNDLFEANSIEALLSVDGYEFSAESFHRVSANASEGYDQATFLDSSGDDRFKATPDDARLYGDGFYNFGIGFDRVVGVSAEGGNDRAYLYDSLNDDTFESQANESRLYNDEYENLAVGFSRVYAYASGGNDLAVFEDTAGDDYYKVDHNGARLYGDGYYNRAIGFETHRVQFSVAVDRDRTMLLDTSGTDDFVVSENQLTMRRGTTHHYVFNPDTAILQQTHGFDYCRIYSVLFDLQIEGDWVAV